MLSPLPSFYLYLFLPFIHCSSIAIQRVSIPSSLDWFWIPVSIFHECSSSVLDSSDKSTLSSLITPVRLLYSLSGRCSCSIEREWMDRVVKRETSSPLGPLPPLPSSSSHVLPVSFFVLYCRVLGWDLSHWRWVKYLEWNEIEWGIEEGNNSMEKRSKTEKDGDHSLSLSMISSLFCVCPDIYSRTRLLWISSRWHSSLPFSLSLHTSHILSPFSS